MDDRKPYAAVIEMDCSPASMEFARAMERMRREAIASLLLAHIDDEPTHVTASLLSKLRAERGEGTK